mmetsp:Transcript_17293/g.54669  ORF Transcript_17293/g.54669 Transcript_17293/m.54669 type:complete len:493 (+) Transcript_17293:118-1596(+)
MAFAAPLALVVLARSLCVVEGLNNGLAKTPPMGYSTWNHLECRVREDAVKEVAEQLLALGLSGLGYRHVNIDDCWMQGSRGADGKLRWQSTFPSGMAAMGDFLHARGLKYGLYTSRGSGSCVGLAGSLDHERQDAHTFAAWGVDFLKNDGCCDTECFAGNNHSTWACGAQNRRSVLNKYRRMRDGLNSTGRPVLYEVCGWEPWYAPVGVELANMFRVGADVQRWPDVFEATQLMHQLSGYSQAGSWTHPDMLIGSTAGAQWTLTPMQSRAQFTLWSIFPAPLILGVNLLNISNWDRQTYSNSEVVQVNQDPLVAMAQRVFCNCGYYPAISLSSDGYSRFAVRLAQDAEQDTDVTEGHPFQDGDGKSADRHQCQQVWARPMRDGSIVLAAVNFADEAAELQLPLEVLPLAWRTAGAFRARDLWARADLPDVSAGELHFTLAAGGGHSMLRLSPRPRLYVRHEARRKRGAFPSLVADVAPWEASLVRAESWLAR